MNDRRKKILNELGLTPRWKIRTDLTLETSVLNDNITGLNELTGDSVDATSENPVYQMSWKQLKLAVSQCTACPLHETRKNTVFGVGDEQADWLL